MGGAFDGRLPKSALGVIRPGDVLFVETFESIAAWVVMYLTKSEISHVAFYLGDNRVGHSTPLSGGVIESIEVLYGSTRRILPCVWPMPDSTRPLIEPKLRELYLDTPYNWRVVLAKAAYILSGRDWPYFRASYLADAAIVLAILDAPFMAILHHPVLFWIWPAYALVVLANAILWRVKPIPFFSRVTEKPSELLTDLCNRGATLVFDLHAINQKRRKNPQ
jgi:hypothetical protein